MSSKLFAFNVSKKPEDRRDQWVGDRLARGDSGCADNSHCTGGQDYGMSWCGVVNIYYCCLSDASGYYICDNNE